MTLTGEPRLAPVITLLPSRSARNGAVTNLESGHGAADEDDMRGPSVTEAKQTYLEGRVARGEIQPSSAAKIRVAIRQFIKAAGDQPVRKVGKADAEAWLAWSAEQGHKPTTRRLRWSYLHVFFEWCVDEELVARNPFRTVKPPKPPRRVPRPLSREEVGRLLSVVPDIRARLIVLLMVQQGLRALGVSNLRIENIDLEERWMRVKSKGGHERTLWITDECQEVMIEYLARYPAESGPLIRAWRPHGGPMGTSEPIASERGVSPGAISKFMAAWMYDAGIKHEAWDGRGGHALRHTCATDMLDQGADIMDVSATLGHSSVATTMIYTEVRPARQPKAMGGRRYGQALSALAGLGFLGDVAATGVMPT